MGFPLNCFQRFHTSPRLRQAGSHGRWAGSRRPPVRVAEGTRSACENPGTNDTRKARHKPRPCPQPLEGGLCRTRCQRLGPVGDPASGERPQLGVGTESLTHSAIQTHLKGQGVRASSSSRTF